MKLNDFFQAVKEVSPQGALLLLSIEVDKKEVERAKTPSEALISSFKNFGTRFTSNS